MTFTSVTVKSVDSKSPYVYPSRTLEIKMDKPILTPTRAATLYEYNQKGIVPTEIPIENAISFSVSKLGMDKLTSFLQTNGSYHNLWQKISSADHRMQYSSFRAHLIQPTTSTTYDKETGIKITPGLELLTSSKTVREKFLRLIVKMQTDLGLDIITIPYLKLPFSEYSDTIRNLTNVLRERKKEPLFVFDLAYLGGGDKFGEAMSHFIKKLELKLLGFPNKSYSRNALSYDALAQYVNHDVAFFSIDAERDDGEHQNISTMHYMPFLANDVYAVKTPMMPRDDPKKPVRPQNKNSIRFFNPSTLLIQSPENRIQQEPAMILQEIAEQDNKKLQTIIDSYDSIGNDKDKLKVFRALSRVHEIKASTKEFAKLPKIITNGESTEYIKTNKFLEDSLNSFKSRRKK